MKKLKMKISLIFLLVLNSLLLSSIILENPVLDELKERREEKTSNKIPKTSDVKYLFPDDDSIPSDFCYAQKAGWAEISIIWSFSTVPSQNIHVWALDSSNYFIWSSGFSGASGYLLSSQSSGSGTWSVPYSDSWHIVYWNDYMFAEETRCTYSATFVGDTRPASISITQPTSTSSYNAGTSQTISWNTINAGNNVKIELYNGGTLHDILYSSTTNDGQQSWIVPSDCTTASNYRIKVSSTSTSASDYSDYFTINEIVPFTVKTPINGDSIMQLDSLGITWNPNPLVCYVDIELYQDDKYILQIKTRILDCGAYPGDYIWKVPTSIVPGSNYSIKISDNDNPLVFGFSGCFTVKEYQSEDTSDETDDSLEDFEDNFLFSNPLYIYSIISLIGAAVIGIFYKKKR